MSSIDDMLNDLEINRRHCNTPVVSWVGWITFLVDGGQDALLEVYRDGLGRNDIVQQTN